MKTLFFLLPLLFILNCYSQKYRLKAIGSTKNETESIDSLNYTPRHNNLKSINEELILLSENLTKKGYLENILIKNTKINDSTFVAKFSLGERTKTIHLYIGRNNMLFEEKNQTDQDTLIIPYHELEYFLNKTIHNLEQRGYALAKIKLTHLQKNKNTYTAKLQIDLNQSRKLNSIIIKTKNGPDATIFPKGHLAQLNRKYCNKTFNQDLASQVYDDFKKFKFVTQIKYPEILFTKDTTKLYVYLEKRKSNNFDGFIGFSKSDNSKIVLNGYLNISLENILHAGEQFTLYWKSDDVSQKTFNTSIEIPYIFKSPLGIKAQLQIFKQDSIYQNTQKATDVGYFFNYNTRFYLGYQSTESSDIQNTNNSIISDYKKYFLTTNLEYSNSDYLNFLFPKKTSLSFIAGKGKRTTNDVVDNQETTEQFYVKLFAMHNFLLNKKNYINVASQNYYLASNTYLINELYRFGGINSIRGFQENSLQANFTTSILTEYRYVIAQNLYCHSILDYAIYKYPTNTQKQSDYTKLLSIGLGLGLQTKNGLLKIVVANGNDSTNKMKFYNTITHICYNVKF